MTRRVACTATLLALMVACARAEPADERNTPETRGDWATVTRSSPPCRAGAVAPEALPALVALRDSMGLLRLPSGLSAREFDQPRTSVWFGQDSTELLAMATDSAPGFLVGADVTGLIRAVDNATVHTESTCRLEVEGRFASLRRSVFVDARATDTVFAMTATVIVRPNAALTLFGAAPTAAMRDSLIAAFVGLRFP